MPDQGVHRVRGRVLLGPERQRRPAREGAVFIAALRDARRLPRHDEVHELRPGLQLAGRMRHHQRGHQHRKHAGNADARDEELARADDEVAAEQDQEHQRQVQHRDLGLVDQQRRQQQQRQRRHLEQRHGAVLPEREQQSHDDDLERRKHGIGATAEQRRAEGPGDDIDRDDAAAEADALRHQVQVLVKCERQLHDGEQDQHADQAAVQGRMVPAQERHAEEERTHLEIVLRAHHGHVGVAEVHQHRDDGRRRECGRPHQWDGHEVRATARMGHELVVDPVQQQRERGHGGHVPDIACPGPGQVQLRQAGRDQRHDHDEPEHGHARRGDQDRDHEPDEDREHGEPSGGAQDAAEQPERAHQADDEQVPSRTLALNVCRHATALTGVVRSVRQASSDRPSRASSSRNSGSNRWRSCAIVSGRGGGIRSSLDTSLMPR